MNKNFAFIGKRKVWYAISLIIIICGLVSLGLRGLNFGIDFTGGNIIQVQFEQSVEAAELRELVGTHVSSTPSIQESEGNVFLIRTEDMTEENSTSLLDEMTDKFGTYEVERNERIGAVIGSELIKNAQFALGLALVLMLLYITVRFKFNYAVAAIVPLIHDVLFTLGVFSILQVEVDSTFVAAILTILGYSINGTIVIFDRIRENRELDHGRTAFPELVNKSINQTLGRSINTVIAVLILVLSLYFLGGETTKAFALALIVGVSAGAYSSVFIAGSILTDLNSRRPEVDAPKKPKTKQDKEKILI